MTKAKKEKKLAPPKQRRLPGAEDPAIEELESLAEKYAKLRDKRQAIGKQEVELKNDLLVAMHRNKKTSYDHNGVSIVIVNEEESVKVRITKAGEEAETEEEL